ncbi:MAG TPA: hypothetical protein PJ994_01910 [Tepidiformaceae bacterium]|nr:hypothetical protein [Tepidiformaceae bacterium]
MRQLGAWLAAGFALAFAVACGTPDSAFPAEAECAPASPLPTSAAVAGMTSPQAFIDYVRRSTTELGLARSRFTSRYPDDTFYRRDAFRPDMARFADETICIARRLRDAQSPMAGLDAWTARIHAAVDDLIDHTWFGREAVRSRNVSEYRQYRAGMEQRHRALELIAFTSP